MYIAPGETAPLGSIFFIKHFPRMLRVIFGIDRPSGFKKMFENNGQMYMYIAPGQGQSTPRCQIFSSTV